MTFQKKVLVISIIILIGTLVLIGYMLHKAQSTTLYPPEISMCPDFWEVVEKKKDAQGMGLAQTGQLLCRPNPDLGDKGNVGEYAGGDFDFNKPEYQGAKGRGAKAKWAEGLGIYWDGITDAYKKSAKKTQAGQ